MVGRLLEDSVKKEKKKKGNGVGDQLEGILPIFGARS